MARGSGKVKRAKWKRVWSRINQNPHRPEQLGEVEFHREGELPSVMARPMSTMGARSTKQGHEIKQILADHKKTVKLERKRLRKVVTLEDSYANYASRHSHRITS